MTREEAIKILKAIRVYDCYPKSASEETKEAIDMAIEALSAEPKTGKWIKPIQHDHLLQCSECEYEVTIGMAFEYDYCPSCGARMRGDDE